MSSSSRHQDSSALRPLSPGTVERIRSTVAVFDVAQCVEELVANAIDADATRISVEIDVPHFMLKVSDNGHGITYHDMKAVGQRYHTSKLDPTRVATVTSPQAHMAYTKHTHGYRGEALASLQYLGVLTITSRHDLGTSTFAKVMTEGNVVSFGPAPRAFASHGTTVKVSDLFGPMPVRQRNIDPVCELKQALERLTALSLAHSNIQFRLVDVSSRRCVLSTQGSQSCESRFAQLLGVAATDIGSGKTSRQMQLDSCHVSDHAHEELSGSSASAIGTRSRRSDGTSGHLELQALWCRVPTPGTPAVQVVAVNGRIVLKTSIHSALSQRLGDALALSDATTSFTATPSSSRQHQHVRVGSKLQPHRVDTTQDPNPTRAKQSKPSFFLAITCDPSLYDITFEPRKSLVEFQDWAAVMSAVEDVINQLTTTVSTALVPSPARPNSDSVTASSKYNRIQSPSASSLASGGPPSAARRSSNLQAEDLPAQELNTSAPSRHVDLSDFTFQGKVQSRSVHRSLLHPRGTFSAAASSLSANSLHDSSCASCDVTRRNASQLSDAASPPKLRPRFDSEPKEGKAIVNLQRPRVGQQTRPVRFSKNIFDTLQVINQADCKFIMCTTEAATSGLTLLAIDQHAAHERVRVEAMLEEYFPQRAGTRTAESVALQKPLVFDVSAPQIQRLIWLENKLVTWGVRFSIKDCQVAVSQLPQVYVDAATSTAGYISRRHSYLNASDVRDFVLDMVNCLSETQAGSCVPSCLQDIMNSRACHSAIKFGDELSKEQCVALIKQLSKCQFPFQCAHGRPSLAPLVTFQEPQPYETQADKTEAGACEMPAKRSKVE